MSLGDISYDGGEMAYRHRRQQVGDSRLVDYLSAAEELLATAQLKLPSPLGVPEVTVDFEHLRWFPFPDELRIGETSPDIE